MPLFAYNRDIPDAPNNPSADQPLMKTNTNNTDDLIDVDHFSFDESNGGLHRQVQLPIRGGGMGTIPPGLIPGEGTLYTKVGTEDTDLFYTPDDTGDQYQLTATSNTQIASFATVNNGWTFLPGGLIFQYGFVNVSGSSTRNITFSRPFNSAVENINVTPFRDTSSPGSSFGFWVVDTSFGTTGFTIKNNSGHDFGFMWTAIGR